ncbi:MAG: hypothetical protein ABIS17_04790 [Casimicrobiaceae bacterium]
MPFTRLAFAAALLGLTMNAQAQRIEISSQSLGTVVVTPAPISGSASTGRQAGTSPRARNGVDFGLRRNPDGSLYDPLDPRQNPPAATTPTTGNRTAGAGAQLADNDVDLRDAGGGIAPSSRYGYASPESAGAPVDIVDVPISGLVPASVPRGRGSVTGRTALAPRDAGVRGDRPAR